MKPTPLIAAAAYNKARFQAAIQTLEDGLKANSIYNVQFKDAKDALTSAAKEALEKPYDAELERTADARRHDWGNDPDVKHLQHMHYYINFNQVPKALRMMKKENVQGNPNVDLFIQVLEEMLTLHEVCEKLKKVIVKGRVPSGKENTANLVNTGMCPVCDRRQKLDVADKMVHHGFEISDKRGHYYGERVGKCFGVDHFPYELSAEGCTAYKKHLKGLLDSAKQGLANLESGAITTLTDLVHDYQTGANKLMSYEVGTPEFPRLLKQRIQRTKAEINQLEYSMVYFEKKIQDWTLQSLKYGRYEK